jgi:3-hydroxyacyl-[acyl-carrier-protein] dehydratase
VAVLEQIFPTDHPAAQGHFPGNPIIPGAVLLSDTLRLIEASLGLGSGPYRIRRAKFPYPARPGDRVSVEFTRSTRNSIRFECAVAGTTVLTGEIECSETSTA